MEEDDMDEEDDEEDEMDEEEEDGKKGTKDSDVHLGKTLFVRNIAYDSTEENLRKKFSEYGEVNYFLVTKDQTTGEPRGTGFVQFKTQEAAQFCLESAYQSKQFHAKQKKGKKTREKRAEESDIMVDGRRLVITLAVSPDESTKITQKKKRR